MKTPSPQEAAKLARGKAEKILGDLTRFVIDNLAPRNGDLTRFMVDNLAPRNLAVMIEASLLEADKNGYERGQEDRDDISRRLDKKLCKAILREMEDDALLLEVHEMLILGDCVCTPGNGCVRCALLKKVESRLAPSVGLSEGKL